MGSDRTIDNQFLDQAYQLARKGWGRTYPNPLVGAVVVAGDGVVSTGWHAEFGGPHAEVVALHGAAERSRGATLYVTLEPCTHQGKQPPCTDAIIAAGIRRVVIGGRDPNPEAGGGADVLRSAGIDVDVSTGSRYDPNFRFLHGFTPHRRPYVAVKLAVSMDGMIADGEGNSRWVSGAAARDWVHWLRAGFGAIGIGARTAIADGARLTVRGPLRPQTPPVRVVFDRSGTLPVEHVVFQDLGDAPLVVVVGSSIAASHRNALLGAGATVGTADTLADAMQYLADQGVDSILIEGGGRLAGALLREDMIDRIYQVQSPRWLGDGAPAWAELGAQSLDRSARWRVVNIEKLAHAAGDADVLIEMER